MIRLTNVTKKYGDIVAVHNLSLHVFPGEVFGFLGPNGAGKTTTLKMLSGLLEPTTGEIKVAGYDIIKEALSAKKEIAFVPDKPFIYEKLTGREFLEFVRDIYGVNGDNAITEKQNRLINLFSLDDWLDELVESYSHGMRQKLIITSALIHNPQALIIDEPMVGLDARGAKQVKELFVSAAKEGTTVLVSTHTMAVAQEVCDRIGILNKGELVAVGTVDELRDKAGGVADDLESIFLALTEGDAAQDT